MAYARRPSGATRTSNGRSPTGALATIAPCATSRTSRRLGWPGRYTPTYTRRPSGEMAMPMPPGRYSPTSMDGMRDRYGTSARRRRARTSTIATPSAVATYARPSAPSARPCGAAPASTRAVTPRALSTKETSRPAALVTNSVTGGCESGVRGEAAAAGLVGAPAGDAVSEGGSAAGAGVRPGVAAVGASSSPHDRSIAAARASATRRRRAGAAARRR